MHTCGHPGCETLVEDRYMFCYLHRSDLYDGECKIHGMTKFRHGRCCKCRGAHRSVAGVTKVEKHREGHGEGNGFHGYRVGSSRNVIWKDHPCFDEMQNFLDKREIAFWDHCEPLNLNDALNVSFDSGYVLQVPKMYGSYGIFVKNHHRKHDLGTCLYIGQSVNIPSRVQTHVNLLIDANEYSAWKWKSEKGDLYGMEELPKMYFTLAREGLDNLVFAGLHLLSPNKAAKSLSYDRKYGRPDWWTFNQMLTIYEQYAMDCLKPELNIIAARMGQ